MAQVAECCGGWHDLRSSPAPMGRVLRFRDARGSEWLGQNQLTGPEGQLPLSWAHIQ